MDAALEEEDEEVVDVDEEVSDALLALLRSGRKKTSNKENGFGSCRDEDVFLVAFLFGAAGSQEEIK